MFGVSCALGFTMWSSGRSVQGLRAAATPQALGVESVRKKPKPHTHTHMRARTQKNKIEKNKIAVTVVASSDASQKGPRALLNPKP